MKKTCLCLVSVFFFISFYSCSGISYNDSVFVSKTKEKIFVRSLAVLPFTEKSILPNGSNYAECALTGLVAVSGETIPGSGQTLSKMIWEEMNLSKNIGNVINWDISDKKFIESVSEKKLSYSLQSTANVGKELGVDTVIVGTILRYIEREGNALAVKQPASTAFTVVLLDVNSGTILWQAKFDKSQKPLSENLFELGSFISGGMKWQSVEDLSYAGVKILIRDLKLFLKEQTKGGAEGRT